MNVSTIELIISTSDRERCPSISGELVLYYIFFFQAEDGIRDLTVTGVQTCALPISRKCTCELHLPLQFCFDDGGANAIHTYIFVRVVEGHGLREHGDASFRGAVGSAVLHRHEAKHRADIDNGPTAGFAKLLQGCARHQKGAF